MAKNEFEQERIDFARYHRTVERQVRPYFRKALKRTIEPVLIYVRANGLDGLIPEALINRDVWNSVYSQIYVTFGVRAAKREYYRQKGMEESKASIIGFLTDVWSGILRSFALTYTYNISRELNDTTVRIIKRAMGEIAKLGLDREGTVRLFEKMMDGEMRIRTNTISRTESTTLTNLGKEIGARAWIDEQGGGGYKIWLGRKDKRERHTHLLANDTVIPVDDLFELGGEFGERPGDVQLSAKERINCRCTLSIISQSAYNALVRRGRIKGGKLKK